MAQQCFDTSSVNKFTNTDNEDVTESKCPYCSVRLAKLKEFDKSHHSRISRLSHMPHRRRIYHDANLDSAREVGCQTSASLFAQAPMTSLEKGYFFYKSFGAETFCNCMQLGQEEMCSCGEDEPYNGWLWDSQNKSRETVIHEDGQSILLHKDYSKGTAAVRGNQVMSSDQHFWEIKMTANIFGTDVMVGVGTSNVELDKHSEHFCSMLGMDDQSWGISYDGTAHHNGTKTLFASKFGPGTIIGLHLDMWHGTLAFSKNMQPLDIAFRGLHGRSLYPMVSSTAARSSMRLVSSRWFPTSLQYLCCRQLHMLVPSHIDFLTALPMPPGLRSYLAHRLPSWMTKGSFDSDTTRSKRKRSLENLNEYSSSKKRRQVCPICLPFVKQLDMLIDREVDKSDRNAGQCHQCVYDYSVLSDDEEDKVLDASEKEESFGQNDHTQARSKYKTSDVIDIYGRLSRSERDETFRSLIHAPPMTPVSDDEPCTSSNADNSDRHNTISDGIDVIGDAEVVDSGLDRSRTCSQIVNSRQRISNISDDSVINCDSLRDKHRIQDVCCGAIDCECAHEDMHFSIKKRKLDPPSPSFVSKSEAIESGSFTGDGNTEIMQDQNVASNEIEPLGDGIFAKSSKGSRGLKREKSVSDG